MVMKFDGNLFVRTTHKIPCRQTTKKKEEKPSRVCLCVFVCAGGDSDLIRESRARRRVPYTAMSDNITTAAAAAAALNTSIHAHQGSREKNQGIYIISPGICVVD